jgi:hypothetical protein
VTGPRVAVYRLWDVEAQLLYVSQSDARAATFRVAAHRPYALATVPAG